MFRRLLVPTDGSDQIAAALPLVRHLASREGASVVLVCVEPPIVNMGAIIDNRADVARHAQRVSRIEQYIEDLQREGIEAHYDVEFGHPESGVESSARSHDSDLIVVTPHQREGFEAVLHPSITARMFSRVPAPLLAIPEHAPTAVQSGLLAEPDAVIVVPLDGSEHAERALPFAIALADEYERGLHLVRVVPPPPDANVYADAYEHPQSRYQQRVHEARRYMSTMQTSVKRARGLAADVSVTIGEPAQEIADVAEEYATSLIVMSTHGHRTLSRMLLGSVATEVMRHSKVPLLIVPPHARVPMGRRVAAAMTSTR
jgi:nucleotide-binding universal stress UspA family protein